MTNEAWCPLPWLSVNVRNNGDLRVCCNANVGLDQGLVKKDDGTMGLFDYNINANSIIIKNKIPESVILNDLPIDEAVKIWRGYFG